MMYHFSFCLVLAFLVEPNLDVVRTQAQLSEPAPDVWPLQAVAPVAIGLPLFCFLSCPGCALVIVVWALQWLSLRPRTPPFWGNVATAKTMWPDAYYPD